MATFLFVLLIIKALSFQFCHGQDNRPPDMISKFSQEYWSNSQSFMLQCKAVNGDIEYIWEKDGVPVTNTSGVQVNSKTGILKLTNIQNTEFGTYQCFAKNKLGVALSAPFKLRQARISKQTTADKTQICYLNKDCTLPCPGLSDADCEPKEYCSVSWLTDQNQDVIVNKRIAISEAGQLIFLYTENKDGRQGFGYRCQLKNSLNNIMFYNAVTFLTINSSPLLRFKPQLKDFSEGKGTISGQSTLSCIWAGYPLPDIKWKSPQGREIRNKVGKYSIVDFGRRLIVQNLSESDDGFYICSANNGVEVNPRTKMLYLNVTSAPFLSPNSTMKNKFVLVNSEVSFVCDVQSLQNPPEYPPSPPTWLKNGEQIIPEKITISEDQTVLTIRNVQKAYDTGIYQCLSNNSEGVFLQNAFLVVVDPFILTKTFAKQYTIAVGEQTMLEVETEADIALPLYYEWTFLNSTKQSVIVSNNSYWRLTNNNRSLTIIADQMTAYNDMVRQVTGQYRVRIYNEAEERILATSLSVEPLEQPDSGQKLWIIGVVIGVILVILIVAVIVIVLKRKGVFTNCNKDHNTEEDLKHSFNNLKKNDKVDSESLLDDEGTD